MKTEQSLSTEPSMAHATDVIGGEQGTAKQPGRLVERPLRTIPDCPAVPSASSVAGPFSFAVALCLRVF